MSQGVPHCTFCDLIRGAAEVSICHEDAESIAFMDIQPVNVGHVLVVPREHYESLLDVPPEIGVHLFRVTMQLAGAVRRVTNCEDMNIVVNSGAAAGQDEPHYHVHIIPRPHGDGFDIPLPFNGSVMPDRTVLDATAARMISALRDPMRLTPPVDAAATRYVSREPATRAVRPVVIERAVSLPVFGDPAPTRAARQETEGDSPRLEGAHGELLRDDRAASPGE